jgi:hypothetical protein
MDCVDLWNLVALDWKPHSMRQAVHLRASENGPCSERGKVAEAIGLPLRFTALDWQATLA